MENQTDGLAQDCSISIANALEILQSCIKRSKYMAKKAMDMFTYPCYELR